MERRKEPRRAGRIGVAVASVVLLVFAIYLAFVAFDIAKHANDVLLGFHEVFRKAIPLGTIVAGALFAVLVYGLCWLHAEPLKDCLKSIIESRLFKHLINNRATYGQILASVFAGASLTMVLMLIPPQPGPASVPAPQTTQAAKKLPPGTGEQDHSKLVPDSPTYSPSIDLPNTEPSPPKSIDAIPPPRPRMAGRDVCDLEEDFTAAEFKACRQDILKHPNRRGIGGRIYIRTKVGTRWVIKPLPPQPPPLDIRPRLP